MAPLYFTYQTHTSHTTHLTILHTSLDAGVTFFTADFFAFTADFSSFAGVLQARARSSLSDSR